MVKLRVQHSDFSKVDVIVTICVQRQLTWTLSVLNVSLDPSLNPALTCFNPTLSSASAVVSLLRALNCRVGNPDLKFLDLWKHLSSMLYAVHIITVGHRPYSEQSSLMADRLLVCSDYSADHLACFSSWYVSYVRALNTKSKTTPTFTWQPLCTSEAHMRSEPGS